MPSAIGHVTPESDNGPLQRAAIGKQREGSAGNFASQAEARQQPKEFATAVAEAALVRCALHQLQSGRFLLVRQAWGMSRELATLDEVRALLRLMGGGGQ